jgi:hypothetical protein
MSAGKLCLQSSHTFTRAVSAILATCVTTSYMSCMRVGYQALQRQAMHALSALLERDRRIHLRARFPQS